MNHPDFKTLIEEKKSLIIIINGKGGSGKDTLINKYQNQHPKLNILNISSIDPIKEASYCLGETKNSNKTDDYRQFLAKLKQVSTEYNDYPSTYIKDRIYNYTTIYWDAYKVDDTNTSPYRFIDVYFVHIREPEEITKLVNWCEKENTISKHCVVTTMLVKSSRTEDKTYGNPSDDNVNLYSYDIIIDNSGSIEETFKVFDSTVSDLILSINYGNSQLSTSNNIIENKKDNGPFPYKNITDFQIAKQQANAECFNYDDESIKSTKENLMYECNNLMKGLEEIIMQKEEYMVVDENNIPIATGMSIETACLLVKAMFTEYYNDNTLKFTIMKMEEEEIE